ncbi:1-(5-phosphoribosyl)-5-[(5-phosphoribosylamino)methylideneamino]imidazole-4-carboxamide isomerase [Acutalibacter sp. 1XD8-36]|uniref:1-(5-phosphoribosyl)-5-[(5- phosphoribosylamino)methylideneamino]imidazole-4- carboxamide isomerase n=1 Tax=Acutalibacter sp. 1XD8-36 TaxID=2320852 RepID=UPI001412A90A|nr:1-(5-phosphoribosyl)-5-[(5-phosphoribosylamino)methylideneamino]imidazole-4-carboxamide isomerase [Acutalibacter sp. 1XD8-36]
MILLPAIDIHEGKCVRLFRGDYSTAEVVAGDPMETAKSFREQGAHWLHMVDLDGAKAGKPINHELILSTADTVNMHVEVGGGIRTMRTVEDYLMGGASRVILGSAALEDPAFVKEAVRAYGRQIAVGIDALDGIAAAEGWTKQSGMDYIEVAKRMEDIGVQYIICTDIHKDGTQSGPNLEMLDKLNRAVSCNIIASGGVSSLLDIINLYDLGLYGAIAGKAVYAGTLDLKAAVRVCHKFSGKRAKTQEAVNDELERFFTKSSLIPAIVQDADTNEVLMLAYMNNEALSKTIETGYTWFYSRSRAALWNKGETSGNTQQVVNITADCDNDTLLVRVHPNGPACHTGSRTCFFKELVSEKKEGNK